MSSEMDSVSSWQYSIRSREKPLRSIKRTWIRRVRSSVAGKIATDGSGFGLDRRLHHNYMLIRADCALVTATDAKHAPYMFNALASIHDRFPTHPRIYVYDLGMNRAQRREL